MEYLETINELNAELYDKVGETEDYFSYSTNGFVDIISFGDKILWNSEMDNRTFNEETDNYEPLTPYIKKIFNKWVDSLQTFRF